MIIADNHFEKRFLVNVWQGSKDASGTEYPRALNMPQVLNKPRVQNMPGFSIYQVSEYALGS